MNSGEKPRPPLPQGPFLVVGLARSGAAIAGVLAERGETVLGVDAGAPEEAAGLEQAGVEVSLGVDGTRQLDRARTLVKSPGVPRTPRPYGRRASAAWRSPATTSRLAADSQRLLRGHRHQRQDHDDRADRPPLQDGWPAGRRRGQHRHPAGLAGRRRGPGGHSGLRGLELPARGHGVLRTRVRCVHQPVAGPLWPPGPRRRPARPAGCRCCPRRRPAGHPSCRGGRSARSSWSCRWCR